MIRISISDYVCSLCIHDEISTRQCPNELLEEQMVRESDH